MGGGGGGFPVSDHFERNVLSTSITNLEARAPPPSYGPAMIQKKTTGVQTKSRMCISNKGGGINVQGGPKKTIPKMCIGYIIN